ncbi:MULTISPECIES: nickel pincer cofactor biosynthesis protein LarB [Falsihalocynthiibacter]|uniref:nickel pincer cofactor biosynthesis protein LarB n=1 Tax=Falsihalocynthiibacter TaxID=2854182 RepID=UPI003002AC4F
MKSHTNIDWDRKARTSLPEVIYAENKSVEHLLDIFDAHVQSQTPLLMTRLTDAQLHALAPHNVLCDLVARTAVFRAPKIAPNAPKLAVVTGGTSDHKVAQEVISTAQFFGLNAVLFADLGVAGLWRLQERLPELREFPLIVAIAGMEGALFSVLAGLVCAPVIAVPTSVGYGVSQGGQAALTSALASCAPGVLTVNIDNGFGAAAAAAKILRPTAVSEKDTGAIVF